MSNTVWPKLVHIVLLSGVLATPLLAQDPQQDPQVPATDEPWIRFDAPTSPAPWIEAQTGTGVEKQDSKESPAKTEVGTEEDTLPTPEDRILASLSPASTWLWIHFKGWKQVLAGDADQQVAQALRELSRRDGALVGRIKDFMDGLSGFASSHGFKRDGFMDLVAEETELSFFETTGKPDFLLFLPIAGRESRVADVLTGFWKPWKAEAQAQSNPTQTRIWFAKSPYPYTKHIYASVEGVHLMFAGSPEAIDLGRSLAQEKGAALAFDEAFKSLFGEARNTETSGWLQVFARPRKAARWILGEDSDHKPSHGLVSSLPVVGFESRYEGGTFTDRLHLGKGESETGLFRILSAGNVDTGFAQIIAKAIPDSIRTRISWKGLQEEMRDNSGLTLELMPLKDLEQKLANTGEGKSLGESLELLTGDVAWLAGDGDKAVTALVLEMKDAFQCKSLLGNLGTPIDTKGTMGDTDGYILELGQTVWFAYMDKDMLYLSKDKERCQTIRSVIASQSTGQTTTQDTGDVLATGRVNSLTWLRNEDPSGNLGLLALAEWFDNPTLVVRKRQKDLEIETKAITGLLPFALVSVDQLLGRLDLRQAAWNKDFALQLGQGMHEAQKTYMLLIEKDEDKDGKGEAGTLTELMAARRVAEARQYRPWGMDVFERSGYRFRMMLPSKVDDRESKFCLIAWPARMTSKRPTCILLDAQGRTYTNELTSELDLETGPEPGQIFSGEAFDSALAAGWELHVSKTRSPTTTAKDPVKTTLESVKGLELEAALKLLDEAWKAKDASRVRTFLDYESSEIQARAAHYLGNLKDKKSVPTLAGLLKESTHQGLRRSVARALALIRDPRATATLLEGLTDPDARVRLYAATAFIANPVPGSLDSLLALVDSYTEDTEGDRSQAMLAIHDLQQPTCLKDLVAVKAGGSRFQQALVYTFQELSPKLEEADEARILIACLSNENKLLRKYAIQRLGEAGYKESVPTLQARLAEEGDELQPILQNSLSVLSPSEGTQKLKENLAVLWTKTKKLAREAKTRFDALPQNQQYAVLGGGGFILLILLFLMSRRRKRKKAAKRALVLELIEHSDDFQERREAQPEGAYEDEAYGDETYDEGYAEEGYEEGQEVYEEEETWR